MLCLGIETSCDETAAAVVRDGRVALSDVVSTQIDIHRRWGGVVPEVASRAHVAQVLPVIDEALQRANVSLTEVDLLSVTSGPGLQGALLVGLQVAKSLSFASGVPLVGVNHLEGHVLAIRLEADAPEPPFLALVVSGGHTTLYDVPAFGTYRRLATTRDDAAGEAYDKVAKLLGLPYPGGQPIDELAARGDPKAIAFPRALKAHDVLDWSFSGLKTAVLVHTQKYGRPQGQALADVCASFQEAVADALTKKLLLGAKKVGATQVVLCGGVA
ncbi:MAG: tRNA (adenosine(37)-N6)-threonylcarbamoyltransferase complex transferase subunit TsaD, partial [Archangium sp.]|nr:tRNA (adenosine(37)-N6)-threonylcarbamoyltransferase complex transferase subunit TsaD [Archangium sp.]